MKMFMYSLYGDARQWYFSLPPSSISSLKDFHKAFIEHCKRYYSDEFAFDNCFEEYKLHVEDEKVNREEDFKFCEDLSTSRSYFSSTFQQRDDQDICMLWLMIAMKSMLQ